jgi:ubiquinone/menaquinone biosynthesis C-methylase UbiE
MMRVISGGVDYVAGVDRGVSFGRQEVLGVDVDIDYAGADLLRHRLPFLDDARRDFGMIRVPVTWIHGEHDAWMDASRARDVMSRGDTSERRFITVPTGHMLRTSREALETFQLVCSEVGRMAMHHEFVPALPDLSDLAARRDAEQARLAHRTPGDLRDFWRRYLLGRDGSVGIELMTHTAPYRVLMRAEVEALSLRPGETVIDLGCGTGAFALDLARREDISAVRVVAVDFVREGLQRSRERLRRVPSGVAKISVAHVCADLDVEGNELHFPVASETMDAGLAGLFLSYLKDPISALLEIRRVLRPGARLVVSSLRRDADFSKLFVGGLEELLSGGGEDLKESLGSASLENVARAHLNEAARLLDFEERGRFKFWERSELEDLLRATGFESVRSAVSLGDPPQAFVVSGVRR